MEEIKLIDNNNVKTLERNKPKQSANALFSFMKEYDYLIENIKNSCFNPRYYGEDFSFLNLSVDYKYFYIPMVCFCDITLNKLNEHISVYGDYGIALTKNWGERNNLQKILYLSEDSLLYNRIRETFNNSFESVDKSNDIEKYENLLIDIFKYVKPISGFQDGKAIYFPDDCEWRFVPNIYHSNDIPEIIPMKSNSKDLVEMFNKALHSLNTEYNLKFSNEDIKYIIVPNKDAYDRLYNDLLDNSMLSLIPKILVWEQIKEDL